MFTPRRPSESAVRALAPRFDVALGTDSRPPATFTPLRVVSSPDLAPAVSTAAVRVAGLTEPSARKPWTIGPMFEGGVVREMGPALTVLAAPVESALNAPTVVLRAGTAVEATLAAVMAVLAAAGLATVGSMLAEPSSPRTRRFSTEPFDPRATLR